MCPEPRSSQPPRRTGARELAFALASGLLAAQVGSDSASSAATLTNPPVSSAFTELAKSAKKLPFAEVIHATTGHQVLAFHTNNPSHVELRRKILQAAALTGVRARKSGIAAARVNEAGNHLEPIVRQALNDVGLEARVPATAAGRTQIAGYPDVEISGALPCYLELKTYSAATADTTQRSFYYSPSATPKVTRDALHLLLAFELETSSREGKVVLAPRRWKLITLENLEVDLKFEFNQSNRGLYGHRGAVLAEDELK